MSLKETLKSLIKQSGHTQMSVAEQIGITHPSLNNRISRDIRVSNLVQILDVIGYRLVIVPKAKKVQGAIEVE